MQSANCAASEINSRFRPKLKERFDHEHKNIGTGKIGKHKIYVSPVHYIYMHCSASPVSSNILPPDYRLKLELCFYY